MSSTFEGGGKSTHCLNYVCESLETRDYQYVISFSELVTDTHVSVYLGISTAILIVTWWAWEA